MLRYFCFTAVVMTVLPAYADAPAPRPLNNLVTELVAPSDLNAPAAPIPFNNPRAGWVFFSLAGASGEPSARLDTQTEPLAWRVNPDTGALECMQHMTAGPHTLLVEPGRGRLAIRAIPELMYCYYPTSPHIKAYGPYDWNYMARHILPHVNVIVSRSAIPPEQFAQWRREGRRWLANASLPGLSDKEAPDPKAVLDKWAQNAGVTHPEYAGVIVDEFGGFDAAHYAAWDAAVKDLHAQPWFAGKRYYAWCTELYNHRPAQTFCQTLMQLQSPFVWEIYMWEHPDEAGIDEELRDRAAEMTAWRKVNPGIERQMVMCPGYLSAPPETLNVNPHADYHVFLDKQMRLLATDPAFQGLFGIMMYMADYADEESLRYAHRLFRHYAIEGNTEPTNADPYLLPHLANGDFVGIDAWQTNPAEPGSIAAGRMKKYSWLQGRYPETTQGNTFCRMRRVPGKENSVAQTLHALTPGRLYSLKYIAANLADLHATAPVSLDVRIDGTEILGQYALEFVYPNLYNHTTKAYTTDNKAWFTWRRIVFRPAAETARLTFADKSGLADAPAEIALNFVEVQPFHAPDEK